MYLLKIQGLLNSTHKQEPLSELAQLTLMIKYIFRTAAAVVLQKNMMNNIL